MAFSLDELHEKAYGGEKPDLDKLTQLPDKWREQLQNVSQWGLKELWCRSTSDEPEKHDRFHHSVGVGTVGRLWLEKLLEQGRIPSHCRPHPLDDDKRAKLVLCAALYLHDWGHLPYSHVFDEVLKTINWVPSEVSDGTQELVLQQRLGLDKDATEEAEQGRDATEEAKQSRTFFGALTNELSTGKGLKAVSDDEAARLIFDVITGRYGVPWLTAMVNSPIDADKIDYLRADSELLRKYSYHPVASRLHLESPEAWLTEFLSEQYVNNAGLLCLDGRSAVAAADLWRERIMLYDRFYLSPEMRVPERMVIEIVQQYIIHRAVWPADLNGVRCYRTMMERAGQGATNPIKQKFCVAVEVALSVSKDILSRAQEFSALEGMADWLRHDSSGISSSFGSFLQVCLDRLKAAKAAADDSTRHGAAELVHDCLVGEPILVDVNRYDDARERLRPLQHGYANEMLIDVGRLPRVLSIPRRWRSGLGRDAPRVADYSILVPSGKVQSWTARSKATVPLSDECVADIERPYCRICVIVPGQDIEPDSPRAHFLYDRVRAVLHEAKIPLCREEEAQQ